DELHERSQALGWIELPPGTSLEAPVFHVPILHFPGWASLSDPEVHKGLAETIGHPQLGLVCPDLKQRPELIFEALPFFLTRVNGDWERISSLGIAPVQEIPGKLVGFITEEILNLAYALWSCRGHSSIDRLFEKLRSDYLRGALFEIQIATN